jgi:hypothetical protein
LLQAASASTPAAIIIVVLIFIRFPRVGALERQAANSGGSMTAACQQH